MWNQWSSSTYICNDPIGLQYTIPSTFMNLLCCTRRDAKPAFSVIVLPYMIDMYFLVLFGHRGAPFGLRLAVWYITLNRYVNPGRDLLLSVMSSQLLTACVYIYRVYILESCTCMFTHRGRDKMQPFSTRHFQIYFFNKNVSISIQISLKFAPKDPINHIPALV